MLYFGYGSNLHRADFARWCAERGHDGVTLRAVRTGWLPDWEVAFHYLSRTRGGGALSIRPRRGSVVPGVLFELDARAWRALDAKEGAPRTYGRLDAVVLTDEGEEVPARTYVVTDASRRETHVPPTERYLRIVCEGLDAHGLPDAHVREAARTLTTTGGPRALFVYGTLMRSECRHALLTRHAPRRIAPASAAGRLVHLGEYPGLLACPRGGRVRGELVELADASDALAELDDVEEFLGYGNAGSLYRRVLIEAREDDGTRTLAWAYRYVGAVGPSDREISSGDWRSR